MLASLIIVFREVFEAGLIVGIVLAATRGVPRRAIFIAAGVAGGVAGAGGLAGFARAVAGAMKAMGQAVAGGDTSLVAMAIVVAIAVLREGAEVVLFLYGVAAASDEGWVALLVGGMLGVALGAAVSFLL